MYQCAASENANGNNYNRGAAFVFLIINSYQCQRKLKKGLRMTRKHFIDHPKLSYVRNSSD